MDIGQLLRENNIKKVEIQEDNIIEESNFILDKMDISGSINSLLDITSSAISIKINVLNKNLTVASNHDALPIYNRYISNNPSIKVTINDYKYTNLDANINIRKCLIKFFDYSEELHNKILKILQNGNSGEIEVKLTDLLEKVSFDDYDFGLKCKHFDIPNEKNTRVSIGNLRLSEGLAIYFKNYTDIKSDIVFKQDDLLRVVHELSNGQVIYGSKLKSYKRIYKDSIKPIRTLFSKNKLGEILNDPMVKNNDNIHSLIIRIFANEYSILRKYNEKIIEVISIHCNCINDKKNQDIEVLRLVKEQYIQSNNLIS